MSVRNVSTLVIGASLDITDVGAIRNQQLITFPSISTTLVGTDVSQTLTNKTLLDTTTSIANTTDPTKIVQFSLSELTTGTTRTCTFPDENITLVGVSTQLVTVTTWVNTPFSDSNYTFRVTKVGPIVVIDFPLKTGNSVSPDIYYSPVAIPVGFCPSSDKIGCVNVRNDTYRGTGLIQWNATGGLAFYADLQGSPFNNAGQPIEIGGYSISYTTLG